MNTEDFVRAIKLVVYKGAVNGTVDSLRRPAGRNPDADLMKLSKWFNGLSSSDREFVERIIDMAAGQATYNFFLVIDGLLVIESVGDKGTLELVHDASGTRTRLNGEGASQLSFLFKEP